MHACIISEGQESCTLNWMFFGRKGDPFKDLGVGSCLTLRRELSKETYVLTRDFIAKGHLGREQKGKETGGLLCYMAHSLRFYGEEISFQLVSGQSF